MLLKKDYRMWLLPQGGVNEGETHEQAIVRELGEEIGTDFLKNINGTPIFFLEDSFEFGPPKRDLKKFEEESKANQDIKGKYYYFYIVPCKEEIKDFTPAKFDDLFWLDYNGARGLMELMYQVKKRELLLKVLEQLKTGGYVE